MESERYCRLLFENNPFPMWVYDLETLAFLAVNDAAVRSYGYSVNEFLVMTIKDICPSEDICDLPGHLTGVNGGFNNEGVWRHKKKDGTIIDVEVTSHDIEFDGRRGRLVLANYLTESRKTEHLLNEQKVFSESLLKGLPVAAFVLDSGHKVILWNSACEELTGVPASDIIGTDDQWKPFYPSRRPVLADLILDRAVQNGTSLYSSISKSALVPEGFHSERWCRDLGGSDRYITFEAAPIYDSSGELIAAIQTLQDITYRKRLEEQIDQVKQDWEHTFNSITDMVIVHDKDYNIVLANKASEKILGLPLMEKTPGAECFNYYHATGSPPEGCPTCRCLKTGVPATFEVFEPRLSMFIEIRAIPRIDGNNRIIGVIHVVRDITEKKKTEEALKTAIIDNVKLVGSLDERVRKRTEELETINLELQTVNRELEMRRMEAESASRTKTDFLAAMSHELRTPLNAIIGFSEILSSGMAGPLNEKQKEFTADICNSGQHLLSLIDDILDISKIDAGKMELQLNHFEIGDLIRSLVGMFREKSLRRRIRLEADIEQTWLTADMKKLKQVIVNLLNNAFKFTPDGGSVRVVTRRWNAGRIKTLRSEQHAEGDPAAFLLLEFSSCNREFIEVSVSDTGIGISEENQKRLFMPFYQVETKLTRKFSGTGLGLSLCRRIIDLHDGIIWVESKEGEGSRFAFVMPVTGSVHPNAIIE